ncbi:SDR family NAD(P)-dependent oxidoreductase [Kineococcus sp. GCM10028916]|uniref:SDR family NAD(P)-dependent oxidoreductase n=1 Tax=Kineococcus sp. GCM10028916 TaxID=3273394 RepID=UPI003642C175
MTTNETPNRTALVTGSTSGIGEAIARTLAAAGTHVLVSGRDATRGERLVGELRAAGAKADFLAADLSRPATELRTLVETATQLLGGRIDVLVNNAGIYPVGPTASASDEDLDAMLAVNVRAPHVLVGQIAPAMVAHGGGAIVNIGSWMSRTGVPFGAMYTATKAAVEQMTRTWAAEFGPSGVRVNTVAPGITLTPGNDYAREVVLAQAATTPAGAPAAPQDVADAVAFLVSDAARMVQGITLDVDGGLTATRLSW